MKVSSIEAILAALDTPIAIKRAAGRPKDLDDVENLERLAGAEW